MFTDRRDAGRQLGRMLRAEIGAGRDDIVVVGLPRGGVPVAAEVAAELHAPLDVIVVRKLGVPHHEELGMGAIGELDIRVLNDRIISASGVTEAQLAQVEQRERQELERRAERFRGDRARISLSGKLVVVVDDGIATGSTARAACEVARALGAGDVVLAVPVAPPGWTDRLGKTASAYFALETPGAFRAIGQFYRDFHQTPDEEVVACLRSASPGPSLPDQDVELDLGSAKLRGHLSLPVDHRGLVIFAHGSGSSRHSPRNRFVADALGDAGLGTLLFDLLTEEEEGSRANVFDIATLSERLIGVTRHMRERAEIEQTSIGYFGASTGAAAALWAAADPRVSIDAVVSRGGRPDLAGPRLPEVNAPTLLIVGSRDDAVLELNRRAAAVMRCPTRIAIVPGATHLFTEPGALERVAELARSWFVDRLADSRRVESG